MSMPKSGSKTLSSCIVSPALSIGKALLPSRKKKKSVKDQGAFLQGRPNRVNFEVGGNKSIIDIII